jgi:hypothetical protein
MTLVECAFWAFAVFFALVIVAAEVLGRVTG